MSKYLGDFAVSAVVDHLFTTSAAAGGVVAPSSAFEVADVVVYKNHSATQRSSAAGMTMTSPFDSIVGLHQLSIDTGDNTDAGFWAAGNDYSVVLIPDTETVDSQTIVAVLFTFSIENRNIKADVVKINNVAGSAVNLERSASAIHRGSITNTSTSTALIDSGLTEAANDHWKGRIVLFTSGTLLGQATDITAFTASSDTLTVSALTGAPANGDTYVIV